MGLFNKKGKEEKKETPKMPELPQLPELPELPDWEKENPEEELPKLPSFPNGSLGNEFSQNTIKEAVSGKKEEEVLEANEFPEYEEPRMMQKPLVRREISSFSPRTETRRKETGPIFIRIDKFEDSLQTFEKAKKQLANIEKTLSDIKTIKEEEARELDLWEKEMKEIKDKIEKIDSNIFSKVE